MSNTTERKRQIMIKRADFLEKRAQAAMLLGRDLTYDKQEAGAIRWLLAREKTLEVLETTSSRTAS